METISVIRPIDDDEAIEVVDTQFGTAYAMLGDNDSFIEFRFDILGNIYPVVWDANVSFSDIDGFFCVYSSDGKIYWKNRLGSNSTVFGVIFVGSSANRLDHGNIINLDQDSAGVGLAMLGTPGEWTRFYNEDDGTVHLLQWTSDVSTSDANGKMCLIDVGNQVGIKNRLGSEQPINYIYDQGEEFVLDDEEEFTYEPGEPGWFILTVGKTTDPSPVNAYAFVRHSSTHVVNQVEWSSNISFTDQNGFICVFRDDLGRLTFKNRIGSQKTLCFTWFSAELFKEERLKVYSIGYVDQLNVIEQAFDDMIWKRGIVADDEGRMAEGDALDLVGNLQDIPRIDGETDEDYLNNILARILSNTSSGTINDLIEIMQKLFPNATIELTEDFPAKVQIEVIDDPGRVNQRTKMIMHHTTGAGIGLSIIVSASSNPLLWAPGGLITAFADAGGGKVTVTCVEHSIAEGDTVVISGTTSYNGTFVVSGVTDDTYDIIDTWVADDATGQWYRSVRADGIGGLGDTSGTYVDGGRYSSVTTEI